MQHSITSIVYSGDPDKVKQVTSRPEGLAIPELQKKSRGRPALGKPVPVVMNDEERAIALRLGNGHIAAGVRRALRIANEADESCAQPVEIKSHE